MLLTEHPRRIPADQLTPRQTNHLDHVLTELGTNAGVIEDQAPVTDPLMRAFLSDSAARELGLTITPGHEIAQCNTCLDILDGALAHDEDDGYIRCAHCRDDWQHTLDTGPDTTAELHDWQ